MERADAFGPQVRSGPPASAHPATGPSLRSALGLHPLTWTDVDHGSHGRLDRQALTIDRRTA